MLREITKQIFQTGHEHEFGVGWCYIIVCNKSLIIVDPGYGWHFKRDKPVNSGNHSDYRSEDIITENLLSLLEFSSSTDKPIKIALLSHSHADHAQNAEFLIQKRDDINKYLGKTIVDLKLVVHVASRLNENNYMRINKDSELTIDGQKIRILQTPGHSQQGDDLSFFLPDSRVLFCGDLCQPQGREFHICEGPSPIPFFTNVDDARKSIQNLMEIDFDLLLTAHGYQYSGFEGKKSLELTLNLLNFIDDLACKLQRENPDEEHDQIAYWIYDTLTYERNFDREKAEFRKNHYDRDGVSDFQKYDKKTIDFCIEKHNKPVKSSDMSDNSL